MHMKTRRLVLTLLALVKICSAQITHDDAEDLAARMAALEDRMTELEDIIDGALYPSKNAGLPTTEREFRMTPGAHAIANDITRQSAAAARSHARAQTKAESVSQEVARIEYQKAVDAARDRVYAAYPIFAKNDGIERLALDAYVTRALSDPNRQEEFRDPNWPAKLAIEFASKYGIKPRPRLITK